MTNQEKVQKAKMEFMRAQVQELELQARYWKAQWESKFYTLQDSKIKDEYDEFVIKTQEEYMNQLAEERASQESLEPKLTGISTEQDVEGDTETIV